MISSVLSNCSILRETRTGSHSRLQEKRGPIGSAQAPRGSCTPLSPHPAGGSGGCVGGRPPTFSWALLNFFCTCLANRPAAPPALPSAILPAPGGLARRPVVFWRPPRRKCGSRHASHPAVAVAAPPHVARDPRGCPGSSGGGLPAQPRWSRGPQAQYRSAPGSKGDVWSGGRTCSEEEAGNLGLPSGGAHSKPALKLCRPEGWEHQPQRTVF